METTTPTNIDHYRRTKDRNQTAPKNHIQTANVVVGTRVEAEDTVGGKEGTHTAT